MSLPSISSSLFPPPSNPANAPRHLHYLSWLIAVRATRGDALLFFHLTPNGNADPNDDHEDCPVPHGQVKWAAEKWIVVQKYMTTRDPDECLDENPKCEDWAASGECTRNPDFMIGKGGYIGQCRKACKVCKPKEGTPSVASS